MNRSIHFYLLMVLWRFETHSCHNPSYGPSLGRPGIHQITVNIHNQSIQDDFFFKVSCRPDSRGNVYFMVQPDVPADSVQFIRTETLNEEHPAHTESGPAASARIQPMSRLLFPQTPHNDIDSS